MTSTLGAGHMGSLPRKQPRGRERQRRRGRRERERQRLPLERCNMGSHDHQTTEHKTFAKPDEIREFPRGRVELLNIGHGEVGRLVLQPGWRWSTDVKPIANTAKR